MNNFPQEEDNREPPQDDERGSDEPMSKRVSPRTPQREPQPAEESPEGERGKPVYIGYIGGPENADWIKQVHGGQSQRDDLRASEEILARYYEEQGDKVNAERHRKLAAILAGQTDEPAGGMEDAGLDEGEDGEPEGSDFDEFEFVEEEEDAGPQMQMKHPNGADVGRREEHDEGWGTDDDDWGEEPGDRSHRPDDTDEDW